MVTSIVLIVVALITLLIYVSAVIRKRPKHANRISAHSDKLKKGTNSLIASMPTDESLRKKGNPRNANALDSIIKEKANPAIEQGSSSLNSSLNSNQTPTIDPTTFNQVDSQPTPVSANKRDHVANASSYGKESNVSGKDFTRANQQANSSKSAWPTVEPTTTQQTNPFADANQAINLNQSNDSATAESKEPRTPFFSAPNQTSLATKVPTSVSNLDSSVDIGYMDMTQVNLTTNEDVLTSNPNLAQYAQAKSLSRTNHSFTKDTTRTTDLTLNKTFSGTATSPISATLNHQDLNNSNLNYNFDLDDVDLEQDYSYNPHGNDHHKSYFSQVQTVEGTADPSVVNSFNFEHKATYEQLISQTLPEDKVDDQWLSDYHFANSATSLERSPEQELSLVQERSLADNNNGRCLPKAPELSAEEEDYDEIMSRLDQELSDFNSEPVASVSTTSVNHYDISSSGVNPIEASIRYEEPVTNTLHARSNSSYSHTSNTDYGNNQYRDSSYTEQTHHYQDNSYHPQDIINNFNSFDTDSSNVSQTLADMKLKLAQDPKLATILQKVNSNKSYNASNSVSTNGNSYGKNQFNSDSSQSCTEHPAHTKDSELNTHQFKTEIIVKHNLHSNPKSNFNSDCKLQSLEEDNYVNASRQFKSFDNVNLDQVNLDETDNFVEVINKSIYAYNDNDEQVNASVEQAQINYIFDNFKVGQNKDNYLILRLKPMRSKVFSYDSIINFLNRHKSDFSVYGSNKYFISFYDYQDETGSKKLVLYEIFTDRGTLSTDYSEYSYLLIFIDKRIFAKSNDTFLSILLSRLHVMSVDLKGFLYWHDCEINKDAVSNSSTYFRKYISHLTQDKILDSLG